MKKIYIVFILTICFVINNISAQDKNGIYIVVSAKRCASYDPNVSARRDTYYNSHSYRDSVQMFSMYVPSFKVRIMDFWHFYRIKPKANETTVNPKDQHKTFLKDSSFLNTVECLYWDDVKDLNYGDARDYIGPLLFQRMPNGKRIKKTIYVIDLAEKHPGGKIKLYQVEDMRKEWDKMIFEDENDKQEWINHSNKVKEKIDKRRADRKAKQFKK